MLKNQNIICISSIDWDFIWQGHQEIMSTFARHGNRVLFIENTGVRSPTFKDIPRLNKRLTNWFKSIGGFREQENNLFLYSPLIFPFPYSRIARWLNSRILLRALKRWLRLMEFRNPIMWTFLPTGIALDIIDNIDKELLVYYCIADFDKLVDNPKKVRRTENELIRKSDLIFIQGNKLREKCKSLNDEVYIFPFGVNFETFENFRYSPDKVPADIKNIKKPIVGYVGGIHKHIDFKLLKYIAEAHPEWSIVLIGPVQTNIIEIKNIKNIFLLGKKDFSDLPYYMNEFSVCIIPYNKSYYTMTVYPTKLNEYHALGKPVVSTDLPEVVNFNKENDNLVLISNTYEQFANCISAVLKDSNSTLANKRIASAKKNSWTNRIEQMSVLIEEAIDKKSRLTLDWREGFLKLYRVASKKLVRAACIFLSIYFLVFYTPIIWWLAVPLKISQLPVKADCIVVFAGGVGESGQAGQGYEERVKYAVDLYKNGYVKNLIFSSGYAYFYKEPLIMKALAISLGVPDSAIILENESRSTYENVKFTYGLLNKYGYKKILLVSSPYHMRRASLVFNKIAKGLDVIYTPIPNSLFYARELKDAHGNKYLRQANVAQIRAIIHEYLGLVYYWWKGYI